MTTLAPDSSTVQRSEAGAAAPQALLLFSFGPVQEFIAAGRRTSDLWAGSFLLAWLAEQALQPIRQALGDENILFPDLKGTEHTTFAALPNRFLARVPADRAEALAEQAEDALRAGLARAARFALGEIRDDETHDEENEALAKEVARFAECYWAALPASAEGLARTLYLGTPDGDADYGLRYRTIEGLVGARKALRAFDGRDESGYRCTLVPSRPALETRSTDPPGKVRKRWEEIAQGTDGRIREGERLSGIALTKRYFPYFVRKERPDVNPGFPSTSSFATADFVKVTIEKARENEEVRLAVLDFEEAVKSLGAAEGRYREAALSGIEAARKGTEVGQFDVGQFHRRSGRLLLSDDLTLDDVKKETGETVSEGQLHDLAEARRDLLQAVQRADVTIRLPSRYYAVLLLDGDRMGQWLSGEKQFQDLERAKRSGPERHRMISAALNGFALKDVPRIVEDEHLGRLVYGGGDDVLALLSFETALGAARALRKAFSQRLDPRAADSDTNSEATASAGLVYAHHLTPLQQVLDAARAAEKRAKDAGRDTLAITALKRSGEPDTAAVRWHRLGPLARFAELIRDGKVSTGLIYDLEDLRRRLADPRGEPWAGLTEAFRAEALRLLGRRTAHTKPDDQETTEAFRQSIEALLDHLQRDYDAHPRKDDPDLRKRPPHPVDMLVDRLRVAQFIGKGGDR